MASSLLVTKSSPPSGGSEKGDLQIHYLQSKILVMVPCLLVTKSSPPGGRGLRKVIGWIRIPPIFFHRNSLPVGLLAVRLVMTPAPWPPGGNRESTNNKEERSLLKFLTYGVYLGGIQKNLPETKSATLSPNSSGIYFWDRIWASLCTLEVPSIFLNIRFFV